MVIVAGPRAMASLSPDPPWPPESPDPPWLPDPPSLPGVTVTVRDAPSGRGEYCHMCVPVEFPVFPYLVSFPVFLH